MARLNTDDISLAKMAEVIHVARGESADQTLLYDVVDLDIAWDLMTWLKAGAPYRYMEDRHEQPHG